MNKSIKKILAGLLTLIFLAFAIVQYNDPDPVIWMLCYATYALVCFSALVRPLNRMWYVFAFFVALVFAFFQWPDQWEGLGETMVNENVERGRESLGLVICALASLLCIKLGD